MTDSIEFTEETEIEPRAIRRLAASKGYKVSREDGLWNCCGLQLEDDEVWSVLTVC